jgi:hypothetical protein
MTLNQTKSRILPDEASGSVSDFDEAQLELQLRKEEWALRRDFIAAARRTLQRYLDRDVMPLNEARAFLELASRLGHGVVHPKASSAGAIRDTGCDPRLLAIYERQLDYVYNTPLEEVTRKLALIPEEEPTM